MAFKVIIIVIELMFLGINMFLALGFGVGPKTYLCPRRSTLLLYYCDMVSHEQETRCMTCLGQKLNYVNKRRNFLKLDNVTKVLDGALTIK